MSGRAGTEPVSLYIHVPFCPSKCAYCDFTSAALDVTTPAEGAEDSSGELRDLGDSYVDAVLARVGTAADRNLLDRVPTVYLGGGTPTLLGPRLVRLVEALRALPGVAPDAEFTVETNPETTQRRLIDTLVARGVTRFSLGVQSFDDEVLLMLGRCHSAERATAASEVLRASGVPFSVDLICGVPGQGQDSWSDSVHRAIATGSGHVSVYPLSIEDGTPMARAVDAGELPEPDPDAAAKMMETAADLLQAAGLKRYEVASYARPGQRSRHNAVYWTGGSYLGIGPSAASMMPLPLLHRLWPESVEAGLGQTAGQDGRARIVCDETLEGFLEGGFAPRPESVEVLSAADALREDAMLGMRMSEGITSELAEKAGVVAVLESLAASGLVEHAGGRWRPTRRGWLLGNEVFSAIWGAT